MNSIEAAKNVIQTEINALVDLKENIDDTFEKVLNEVLSCEGKVVFCGMGKPGHIASKLAATMSSLGMPSFALHPAEALHGDVGMVSAKDVVILISHSGESDEITRLLTPLKFIGARLIAITSDAKSTLAKECDIVQVMPNSKEACALNLAPTSSTTATLAYGDALAVVASQVRGIQKEDFARFHPAGALGRKLLIRVSDIMSVGDDTPKINENASMTEALVVMSQKGLGVVVIVDDEDKLLGLLTDGDLRRAIERKMDLYKGCVTEAMTNNPKSIQKDILAVHALKLLREFSINNYPVVDEENKLVGVVTWQQIIKAGIIV